MASLKYRIKVSPIARLLLLPRRWVNARRVFKNRRRLVLPWLLNSKETTNFTYELTELGFATMAHFVAVVSSSEPALVASYLQELRDDEQIREHVRTKTAVSEFRQVSDANARPGKRYMYYAFVRALKPKLIVEAGTDKGFGTIIMAKALQRNEEEGHRGRIVTLDMNPNAGFLFTKPFTEFGEKFLGSSVEFLHDLTETVDFFVHDTTNDPEHEREQFNALSQRLGERAVICSAWSTPGLVELAENTNRSYLVYPDDPHNHWHPGSYLGVAFPRS